MVPAWAQPDRAIGEVRCVRQRDNGGRSHNRKRSLTTRPSRRRGRSIRIVASTLFILLALPAQVFASDLPRPEFGPGIDPFATYVAQSKCSPKPKPGVVSFQRLVTRSFPSTSEGYISRACYVGGQSEHKEGRAWDWPVSAYSKRDRRKVNKLLDWLLKRDAYRHKNARVRRLGIMYIIWNRRIWLPYNGWQAYHGSSPHTDHVHFSFTWPGARRRTTNWHRSRSFITSAVSNPTEQGFWSTTGTATVLASGGGWHGDHRERWPVGSVLGIAATPRGDGYWLAKRSGKVLDFGDARKLGSYKGRGRVTDIAATPRGQGFWTVTSSGRVKAFGNAEVYGQDRSKARIVGIAPTPNGTGYWLATKKGRVFQFGNARDFGDLTNANMKVVDIEPAPTQGFWLVTRKGRVTAFGAARFKGDLRNAEDPAPVVALASSPSGNGYWLINRRGKAREFGTATELTSTSPTSSRPEAPAGGVPVPERREGTDYLKRWIPAG
jgi:hypothetical protein